jgi:hypothetical protein
MNVDVFLDESSGTRARLERILSAYPDLFQIRWHAPGSHARFAQLYHASLPLDASTGHGPAESGHAGYGAYGYYGGEPLLQPLPALALFDRLALLPASGGPPRNLRPSVWEVPFPAEDLLRAAFHQALEAALAELRAAYVQLRATHPGILELPAAAALLQVTPAALRRALRK